jgi:serine/threonine protein kinase
VLQACPNCGRTHDVGVFVAGQPVTCEGCGIRFPAERPDVRAAAGSRLGPEPGGAGTEHPGPRDEPGLAPTVAHQVAPPAPVGGAPPQVPGYALEELLGRGGMGEVWRARQLSLDRVVAVKLLPERWSRNAEFVARFEKETRALAAISHPNIVQIIDRGGHAGQHYFFAMELVRGVNLREMLGAPLPPRDALRIASQVARGLDAAHEQRIVHRDLKPENVLVDPRGHVKIADFGLAGMLGGDRTMGLTDTAVAMGTLNYMAPEQRRDAKHVDLRADLYSLGVVLYEMLTAQVPLGRFKLPSQLVPGVDPGVDQVLGQLLEAEPAARPRRALDVAVALEALTPGPEGRSGEARPRSRPFALDGGAGRRHGRWWVPLAVLAVLGGLGSALKCHPTAVQVPAWYDDLEDELYAEASGDPAHLKVSFEAASADAGEEINAHTGAWSLKGGWLEAYQFGDPVDELAHPAGPGERSGVPDATHLVPRAFLAHRYFSADDVEVAVEVALEPLGPEFPVLPPERTPQFGEVAFRIRDLQVSLFAVPASGMRLSWRYFTATGQEHSGDSARDQVDELLEDAVGVPRSPFRLRLRLHRLKNGDVNAEAYVNELRFARKVLPGLAGQVGKIALGCRNLHCRFGHLEVSGHPVPRPAVRGP